MRRAAVWGWSAESQCHNRCSKIWATWPKRRAGSWWADWICPIHWEGSRCSGTSRVLSVPASSPKRPHPSLLWPRSPRPTRILTRRVQRPCSSACPMCFVGPQWIASCCWGRMSYRFGLESPCFALTLSLKYLKRWRSWTSRRCWLLVLDWSPSGNRRCGVGRKVLSKLCNCNQFKIWVLLSAWFTNYWRNWGSSRPDAACCSKCAPRAYFGFPPNTAHRTATLRFCCSLMAAGVLILACRLVCCYPVRTCLGNRIRIYLKQRYYSEHPS